MNLMSNELFKAVRYALYAGTTAVVGLSAAPVLAQDESSQQLETITVTGSNIRRVDIETSNPVVTIDRAAIEKTGKLTLGDLVQSLPAVTGPNMNPQVNNSGGTGFSSIGLRGLGSPRTLVLINGHRYLSGDPNAIPANMVERIEVLTSGASAVYGSDAIAGVVNFILTKDYTGAEVGVTYGAPTRSGDGENLEAHVVAGWGNLDKDRFNITVSGSYQKEEALWADQRNFAKTGNQFPWLVSGATGQGNIEGGYNPALPDSQAPLPGFGSSPATGYGNPLGAQNRCEDINMFLNPDPTVESGGKPGGFSAHGGANVKLRMLAVEGAEAAAINSASMPLFAREALRQSP